MVGRTRKPRAGFSVLELVVSIAIIGVLLSMLLPLLSAARNAGYRSVCANNLRQMNVGWQGYVLDNKDRFPQAPVLPDWRYGGVTFAGIDREPRLDPTRPINKYLVEDRAGDRDANIIGLFRCPSDAGVFAFGQLSRGRPGQSLLPDGQTCFNTYGNSYRANPMLLDSTRAGLDKQHRPLALHEIYVDTSRLLITADPAWYFATIGADESIAHGGQRLDASWHTDQDSGNALAVDGSIRFLNFSTGLDSEFTLWPRPRNAK
ncbi:MAG: prepilin-type N-terminal cleavage/methylation domain-containing protein [Phycisphaeraceae bacterium]|nr:prepilin-type N-terminal cleavage/methylation domain-containing protein [Phycisphaeraceae bacterium]